MKRPDERDPARWRERGSDVHTLEARAAALADAAAGAPSLGPEALARIRGVVSAGRPDRVRRRGLLLRGRIAFAIGLVLLCVTTAGGARMLWRKLRPAPAPQAPPAGEPTPAVRARRASSSRASVALADPGAVPPATEALPDPVPAEPLLAKPVPSRTPFIERPAATRSAAPLVRAEPAVAPARPKDEGARTEPPPVDPSEAAPAGLSEPARQAPPRQTEAGLIAEALSELRQRRDPRGALAALDRYARAFPHGVLETEALRTRIEALVAAGDLPGALARLDGVASLAATLGGDLLLTRAELRASVGRFREAAADFSELLDGGAAPLTTGGEERALYGRAVCLGRLGQDQRARLDLRAYARRYPTGRFAAEVGRLLSGAPPSTAP